MAIPVMSVDSLDEAEELQTLVGCCSYDNSRYTISPASGFVRSDVSSLDKAGEWLESMYQRVIKRPIPQ